MRKDKTEQWRPVLSCQGYEVSSLARVRRISDGKLFTGTKGKGWVRQVVFREYCRTISLHCLVALMFIGPCPTNHRVQFRDGDRSNCAADNLFYALIPSHRADTPTTKGGTQTRRQATIAEIWMEITPAAERGIARLRASI